MPDPEAATPQETPPEPPPKPAHLLFVIDRNLLAAELALVTKVVEQKSTIPILGNVLIEACSNNTVRLTGTDLEVGLIATLPATVKQPGSITLPAKRLLDTVRKLPNDQIVLLCLPDWNNLAVIKSGPATARLAGMGVESFPELPKAPKPVLRIPVSYMTELIRRTSFAISVEESRFTLNGALLEANGALRMVATDGHRLALAQYPVKAATEIRALIPRFALSLLPQLAKDGTFEVSRDLPSGDDKKQVDGNHLWFRVGNHELITRRLRGNFPDYERVIPAGVTFSADMDRLEATKALERARSFADERSRAVRFDVTPGRLKFHTYSGDESAYEESVPAIGEGTMQAGYNADYVLEYLKRETTERFTLSPAACAESGGKPDPGARAAVLQAVGSLPNGLTCKYVVMPMRI